MTKTYRKTISNCIEKIGKKYRCRVSFNGKRYSHYETNLNTARSWVKLCKTGKLNFSSLTPTS